MYLRFITEYKNEWNEDVTGVFQALGHLIRSNEVFDYDKERLEAIRNWFNKELERPEKFNKHSNKNKSNVAISWFKDSAKQHLENMYALIPIFDNYGIQIEVIKTQNPGYKVFEDNFQVVTIPHGKDKSKVL
jgi:hypothetical protein